MNMFVTCKELPYIGLSAYCLLRPLHVSAQKVGPAPPRNVLISRTMEIEDPIRSVPNFWDLLRMTNEVPVAEL